MTSLSLRDSKSCLYDIVSLGEVMLRFDPGASRIHTTRQFTVWEGGGEYNVARGLRRCFGRRAAVVTALVDNSVGRLVEDLMLQGGVAVDFVRWVADDGCGRTARNGLNFTERGFGVRGAMGTSDRGHTAVSQLRPGDIDWEMILGEVGARWLHTGGIFAALSTSTAEVAEEAMRTAQEHGVRVSYDLNYRPSLWTSVGGKERARQVNSTLAPLVDVMLGNEEDFTACLGYEVSGVDENLTALDPTNFQRMIDEVTSDFPNLSIVATTLRGVTSASLNDWGAVAWSRGEGHVAATPRPNLEILDRVGGGDSFASGLIHALLDGRPINEAVEYGAAHGALAMTTPGDTSMARLSEVERLIGGAGARVQR